MACGHWGLPGGLGSSQRKGIQGPVLGTERLEESFMPSPPRAKVVVSGRGACPGFVAASSPPASLQACEGPEMGCRRPPPVALPHVGGGRLTHQATQATRGLILAAPRLIKEWLPSGFFSVASGEARSFLGADQHGPPGTPPLLSGTSTLIGQCLSHAGG